MAPEMGQLPSAVPVVPVAARTEAETHRRPSSRASSLTLALLGSGFSRRSSSSSFTIVRSTVSDEVGNGRPLAPPTRLGLRAWLAALLCRRGSRPTPAPNTDETPSLPPLLMTPVQEAEMQRLAQRIEEVGANGGDARVLQLKYDAILANVSTKPRATDALFKEACSTDLLFLIDTTGSMMSYIEAAKTQVKSIVDDIKEAFFNEADVRIAVVGYKDHGDPNSIQFLDFTPSADTVRAFIDGLTASGGGDAPEDVLGGIQKALNASWIQQTRCIIHIADAPPHGDALNSYVEGSDRWHVPGSEPHKLTHTPLLKQMVDLNINYALLRINDTTDKMAYTFLQAYAPSAPGCKLLEKNCYYQHAVAFSKGLREKAPKRRGRNLQFEEQELGTTYSALRHLVVRNITASASRTASRMSGSTARDSSSFERNRPAGGTLFRRDNGSKSSGFKKWSSVQMKSIKEDDGADGEASSAVAEEEEEVSDDNKVKLETASPQWASWRWLDRTLHVEAYSTTTTASSLDELLDDDTSIQITVADLAVRTRSKPFAQGAQRVAFYARTAASTSPLVVKSFKRDGGKQLAHLADDMRCQALCKAFALEFSSLLLPSKEHAVDFVVTTCLRSKNGRDGRCLSLEPFLEGEYVKYNSNSGYVNEEAKGPTSEAAQAFSHFTFERSRGRFLVSDLQGVGGVLTDPAIHSRDPERFKLLDTNLGEAGFKFFFATHRCNSVCVSLGLKTRAAMLGSGGKLEFREAWLTLGDAGKATCCANRMCRRIIEADKAKAGPEWEGSWCKACWPQLENTKTCVACHAGGVAHDFFVSQFYYESQGLAIPKECVLHRVRAEGATGGVIAERREEESTAERIATEGIATEENVNEKEAEDPEK